MFSFFSSNSAANNSPVAQPTKPSGTAKAIKWLKMETVGSEKKEKMTVNQEESARVLSHVKAPQPHNEEELSLNLISIFGAARQGKSFLMNLLAGQQDLFPISNCREPCTQGVDLSNHFMSLDEFSRLQQQDQKLSTQTNSNISVGFVDAEGQGDRDITYDSRLVSPVLLTSKCVLFNWKDSLQADRMLNLLAVLARAAQGIESAPNDTNKIFGHLHIVFRDWSFINSTPDQVYRDLFQLEKGRNAEVSVRNQARTTLIENFQSITIWLFPSPVADTATLSSKIRFEQLQPTFQTKLTEFRRALSSQLSEPMYFNRKKLTPRKIAQLMPILVDALNADEVIMPEPIFSSMLRLEASALRRQYEEQIKNICEPFSTKSPLKQTTEKIVALLSKKIDQEVIAVFEQKCQELQVLPEHSQDIIKALQKIKLQCIDQISVKHESRLVTQTSQQLNECLDQMELKFNELKQTITSQQIPLRREELLATIADIKEAELSKLVSIAACQSSQAARSRFDKTLEMLSEPLQSLNQKLEAELAVKRADLEKKQLDILGSEIHKYFTELMTRQKPFTVAQFKTHLNEVLVTKSYNSFTATNSLLKTNKNTRRIFEEYCEQVFKKEIVPLYERHISSICQNLVVSARDQFEGCVKAQLDPILPLSQDTEVEKKKFLQTVLDDITSAVKLKCADKLQGWTVLKQSMTQLSDLLDGLAQYYEEVYWEKHCMLANVHVERQQSELFQQARSLLMIDLRQEVVTKFPIIDSNDCANDDRIQEIRAESCRLAAYKYQKDMQKLGQKVQKTMQELIQQFNEETEELVTQLQMMNHAEVEKAKALDMVKQEQKLRAQAAAKAQENEHEICEMRNYVNKTLSSKEAESRELMERLALESEKNAALATQILKLQQAAVVNQVEKTALEMASQSESNRRQQAEAAANKAAQAAEVAAKAALEALEYNQQQENRIPDLKIKEEDIVEDEVKRETAKKPADKKVLTRRKRGSTAAPTCGTPLKKKRQSLSTKACASSTSGGGSGQKLSLAEARKQAAEEMEKRIQARTASLASSKSRKRK